MTEDAAEVERKIGYHGGCDNCGAKVVIDGDGAGVPEWVEWETFPQCPVCGDTVYFDEMSETLWDRESRLMRQAAKQAVLNQLRAAADELDSRAQGGTAFNAAAEVVRDRARRLEEIE